MWQVATAARASTFGRISAAPRAQLIPTLSRSKCETECQNASIVCPERVRPALSMIVPETITGRLTSLSTKYLLMAKRHAFMFRVSKLVSGNRMSDPADDQAVDLFVIGVDQLVEGDVPVRRVGDVGGDGGGLIGRPDAPGDEPGAVGGFFEELVGDLSGERGGGPVHLEGEMPPGRN